MRYASEIRTTTLVQIGPLDRTEAEQAVGVASEHQICFEFSFHKRRFPLDKRRYGLKNGGFDLDNAIEDCLRRFPVPRPVMFVTSAAYGERQKKREPGYFFFSGHKVNDLDGVSVLSTYLWQQLPGDRQLQPYFLRGFAIAALDHRTSFAFHAETRGCLLDYCDEPSDIDVGMQTGDLCRECSSLFQAKTHEGEIAQEELADALRLAYRAAGKKLCFILMPFAHDLEPVYRVVSDTLQSTGWTVKRADEISHPRRVTDAIWQYIMRSDLIIADLTRSNANVFYEVGLSHAMRCDVILLTQERTIPFDIAAERAVFYRPSGRGLKRLSKDLLEMVEE